MASADFSASVPLIAVAVVWWDQTQAETSSGKTRLLLADSADLPHNGPNDNWASPSLAG